MRLAAHGGGDVSGIEPHAWLPTSALVMQRSGSGEGGGDASDSGIRDREPGRQPARGALDGDRPWRQV